VTSQCSSFTNWKAKAKLLEPKEIAQDAGEAFSWLNIRTVLAVGNADLQNFIGQKQNPEINQKARIARSRFSWNFGNDNVASA
jgi:hypothetical protein